MNFRLSSLHENFEPRSPDAKENVALPLGLIDLRLPERRLGRRGVGAAVGVGLGVTVGVGTALGPGVTVGVG